MLAHANRQVVHHRTGGQHGWQRWIVAGFTAGLLLLIPPAHAGWTAAIRPDPLTRQLRCLLSSDTVMTSAGHDDATPVTLVLNNERLLAITQSELDASFADLQLTVDKNPPIRAGKIEHKMILVVDQAVPDLIRQLRGGYQLTVYLRFWPTWPATQSFPVTFNLNGFSKAYETLQQNCQPAASAQPSR